MIYIVEDDAAIRELEQYALQSSGYEVQSFETSEPFWQAMRTAEPELVILDVMLPGEDGFSILKKLRNTPALRRLPIIMVTAKSSELDTVRGLDCGADDYITKPFGIMEFLSRVRAALRRSAPEEKQNVYAFHEILLDNARHSVTVNGTHIDLTYKEYSLLRLLLENTNLVVTRETILQVVWGTDISVESRTVDMHIRTLRKKLGDAGRYICTVRKVGYKLADNEEGEEECNRSAWKKKSVTGCFSWASSVWSAPPCSVSSFLTKRSGNRRGPRWSIRLIWFPPDTSSFPLRISSPCSSTETCALP